ncbi:hypothetical protein MYSTI_03518 [Myxococcus stipitatus DSM 14675]|uniref:Uncharacterized protein n=1 Tax=Myxococcus stipitatus (strain DSM 14675 / JCM 12634 / Mx s8) TaxID=1278073 RepID=L7UEE9_MYXSD|nr:hypothetical protein [Myxococcus stipitatus]AGC44829.1 hypothetical protein MYSTI_03518 [Myxococcus stipitatus DSM 14675]
MSSTLESYELIRFAEAFESRLATAGEMLAGRPGLEAEKSWLATALELVRTTRSPAAGVVDRVKDLPELEEAREEYAFQQQGLWVDALEKLHAGITFTASSRAPVIEALFPHVKFAQLRRAPREIIFEYATSYERRTRSAYVSRIFAREDFALVRPVMETVATAHSEWRSSHEPAPLSPEVEIVLREELVNLGRKLEIALRQARLLSEAALVPVPSVHEAAALGLKPKRRAGRGLAPSDDGIAALDLDPADSMEPTEAELAEVAALDAGTPPASEMDAPEGAAATDVDGATEDAAASSTISQESAALSDESAPPSPALQQDDSVPAEAGSPPTEGGLPPSDEASARSHGPRGRKREAVHSEELDAGEPSAAADSETSDEPSVAGSSPAAESAAESDGPRSSALRGRGRKRASEAGPAPSTEPTPSEPARAQPARERTPARANSVEETSSEGSRAQAPSVRKKKGTASSSGAAGTESP